MIKKKLLKNASWDKVLPSIPAATADRHGLMPHFFRTRFPIEKYASTGSGRRLFRLCSMKQEAGAVLPFGILMYELQVIYSASLIYLSFTNRVEGIFHSCQYIGSQPPRVRFFYGINTDKSIDIYASLPSYDTLNPVWVYDSGTINGLTFEPLDSTLSDGLIEIPITH